MSICGNVCSKKGELNGFRRFFFNGKTTCGNKKKSVLMLKVKKKHTSGKPMKPPSWVD